MACITDNRGRGLSRSRIEPWLTAASRPPDRDGVILFQTPPTVGRMLWSRARAGIDDLPASALREARDDGPAAYLGSSTAVMFTFRGADGFPQRGHAGIASDLRLGVRYSCQPALTMEMPRDFISIGVVVASSVSLAHGPHSISALPSGSERGKNVGQDEAAAHSN